MQNEQLSLFAEPSDAINRAIARLSTARGRTPAFTKLIAQAGSLMLARPRGSLIIVTAPSGFATDQACAAIEEYLEDAKSKGYGPGRAGVATVEIPHATSRRLLQRQIPEIYTSLPAGMIGHIHKPQFFLDFSPGYVAPNPLQQICGLLRARPIEYYLVTKAHYLSPAGSSVDDGINQVRFFIQLAAQSKRTHVLFTNASTAREWLGNGEITNEVSACWLRPYNRADKESSTEFRRILKGYDEVIPPREKGFTLVSHAREIHDAVCGCTFRLSKWVLNTLVSVRARGGDRVSWRDFCECAPSAVETNQAQREYDDIKAMSSALTPPVVKPEDDKSERSRKGKGQAKPGQRSLGRDRIGLNTDAAA